MLSKILNSKAFGISLGVGVSIVCPFIPMYLFLTGALDKKIEVRVPVVVPRVQVKSNCDYCLTGVGTDPGLSCPGTCVARAMEEDVVGEYDLREDNLPF